VPGAQRVDVALGVAELAQQFGAVLAHVRRLKANAQARAVQGERKERGLRGFTCTGTVGQSHIGQAARGRQVRVVEQLLGPADRREGQAVALEDGGKLGSAPACQALAQYRHEPGALPHAIVVAAVARVGQQVLESEGAAEHFPLGVADRGQEDLLAVLDGEYVVHRPGGDPVGHGRRGLAGDGVLQHVLPDQEDIVLEQ
jgi:hypothetical protein